MLAICDYEKGHYRSSLSLAQRIITHLSMDDPERIMIATGVAALCSAKLNNSLFAGIYARYTIILQENLGRK